LGALDGAFSAGTVGVSPPGVVFFDGGDQIRADLAERRDRHHRVCIVVDVAVD
jgi:hypothetical protein